MTAREAREVARFHRPAEVAARVGEIAAEVQAAARCGLYSVVVSRATFDPTEADQRTAALVLQSLEADGFETLDGPDGLLLRWSR